MASQPKGPGAHNLSTEHAASHEGSKFPPFDPHTFAPQLVWLLIAFGALYLLLSRLALPRIGEVIGERRDRIERDLAAAEKLKSDTDAALKAYEKALADARGNAQALAKTTRDGITAQLDAERQRADREIAAKLAETDKRIADTKTRALAGVNDIATDTAGAIVSRLIGKDVPAEEIRRALTAKG